MNKGNYDEKNNAKTKKGEDGEGDRKKDTET